MFPVIVLLTDSSQLGPRSIPSPRLVLSLAVGPFPTNDRAWESESAFNSSPFSAKNPLVSQLLQGRRILLTGVSRGVGLASARLLLREGAQVLGVARDSERLSRAQVELATLGDFTGFAADLALESSVDAVQDEAARRFGALDVVIHNAGVMLSHDPEISGEPAGRLEETLAINLYAPFRLTRAVAPLLLKGTAPRVINVSSGAGTFEGMLEPKIASYRLSKWALNGLTILQAKEWAGKISVIAFDPGWVKTDLGGPAAPGTPEESAGGLLQTLLLPQEVTGQFVKDGQVLRF